MLIRRLALLGQHHFSASRLLIHARYFSHELVANWPEAIKKFLQQEKIEKPTLIQEKTLPIAMQNKNLVGIARTGSGKTLAFVIPAVMKVLKSRDEAKTNPASQVNSNLDDDEDDFKFMRSSSSKRATCLILAPTRELATQTSSVFAKFRQLGLKSISLVGGSSRSEQMRELQRGNPDVYVATPGRLMDLVDSGIVDLRHIKYLVLDEADRMLDMGFEPQIRRILEQVPKERQTLMWSATWPTEIQSLAAEFLHDYEYVAVDSETLKANPNIKQVVEICEPQDKLPKLLEYMRKFKEECEEPRVLIFVNTKRLADQLLIQLMRNKIRAISIHGDRSQKQRDDALRLFRNRSCHVMVATDVAARGLDINDITHVVNFDFPNLVEDYVHRIGRTARHERSGTAITLFTMNDINMSDKLIKVLKETNQEVPEKLEELARNRQRYRMESKDYGRNRRRQHNDFYSGRSTSRFGRDIRNSGFENNREARDICFDDRMQNRSYENQDKRRFMASNIFDD